MKAALEELDISGSLYSEWQVEVANLKGGSDTSGMK